MMAGSITQTSSPTWGMAQIELSCRHAILQRAQPVAPSWASANRFLTEVFEPSTVGGYYQPLAMISLREDVVTGKRTDDPWVFHRTSLALREALAKR